MAKATKEERKKKLRKNWQKSIQEMRIGTFNSSQGNPSSYCTVGRTRYDRLDVLNLLQEVLEEEGFTTLLDNTLGYLYIEWPGGINKHPKIKEAII